MKKTHDSVDRSVPYVKNESISRQLFKHELKFLFHSSCQRVVVVGKSTITLATG